MHLRAGEECGPRERAEEEGPGAVAELRGGAQGPAQARSSHMCFAAMESERIRKSVGDGNLESERIRTTLHLCFAVGMREK